MASGRSSLVWQQGHVVREPLFLDRHVRVALPPPASPDRQGSAPAEPLVWSRLPRPLQAKTGGGEDDTDLIPPDHLQ
eukprot:7339407-Prymnesium_polylepis.2